MTLAKGTARHGNSPTAQLIAQNDFDGRRDTAGPRRFIRPVRRREEGFSYMKMPAGYEDGPIAYISALN
jgi:hypothetical protein